MGTQCVYVWPASMHVCVTALACLSQEEGQWNFQTGSPYPSGVLEKYRRRDTHSSGRVVRGWRDTINNKRAGVTGPVLQSQENSMVSSISYIDLQTHTHRRTHEHTAHIIQPHLSHMCSHTCIFSTLLLVEHENLTHTTRIQWIAKGKAILYFL